jgi:hypothetical protein
MYTLSLKNFKHFPSLSEETNCFTADLYINKKLVGYAENRGYGGETSIRHSGDFDNLKVIREADAYFKALPMQRIESEYEEKGYFELPRSLEWEVDSLVDQAIMEKDKKRIDKWVAKHTSIGIVIDGGKGTLHFYPFDMSKPMPIIGNFVSKVMDKHPNGKILNPNIASF